MNWLSVGIIVLQTVLLIGGVLAWRWLKELPAALHRQQERLLQHELSRELEVFKNSMSREIELLKISQAELQVRKTEEFIGFANLQREFLTDKSLLKKLEAKDAKTLAKLTKQILDLGTGLFFFASDETVRKYGAWKVRSATGEISGVDVLRQFGELMVALRRDLGQSQTELNGDDFLRLIITDWSNYESREEGTGVP